ncbi:MAG: hypothetical protein WDA75_18560 [Candidatus Latescibacterota bacterium]|jgi:hypothetical protein
MIRLTEQSRHGRRVCSSLDGYLCQDDLALLSRTLTEYRDTGVGVVELRVDGLQLLDPVTARELLRLRVAGLEVCFQTTSAFLQAFLASHGVAVELPAPLSTSPGPRRRRLGDRHDAEPDHR